MLSMVLPIFDNDAKNPPPNLENTSNRLNLIMKGQPKRVRL